MVTGLEEQGTKDSGANGQVVLTGEAMEAYALAEELEVLRADVLDIRINEKNYLLCQDLSYVTATYGAIDEFETAVRASDIPPEHADELVALTEQYRLAFQTMVDADTVVDGERAELVATLASVLPHLREIEDRAAQVVAETRVDLAADLAGQRIVLVGVAVIAGLAGAVIAFVIARSLVKSARRMVAEAEHIADVELSALAEVTGAIALGHLTRSVTTTAEDLEITSSDEMGDLALASNKMIDRLRQTGRGVEAMVEGLADIIGQTSRVSRDIDQSAQTLANGANDSAQGASDVADAVESVSHGAMLQSTTIESVAQAVDAILIQAGSAADAVAEASLAATDASTRAEPIARFTTLPQD